MTLTTTEELKHLASSDNANELTRRLARECLANREAQPVAWRYRTTDINGNPNPNWSFSEEASLLGLYQPLYTAPPAPAVPGIDELRLTFERSERESDDGFNLHKYGIGYADEATQARWESWLSCRAAMLTQPVSSGYKLPEGWMACSEMLPEPTLEPDGGSTSCLAWYKEKPDCGHPYAITNVHYLIKHWDKWYTHWMPLPAAPKGGN